MHQEPLHSVLGASCLTAPSHCQDSAPLQVPCYGTRTTAATEAWVQECVASGRGAKYGLAQLGVTQGGCIEPRLVARANCSKPSGVRSA